MRAGSNARARRTRFGTTPSIQMVSELMWKNGAPPKCGIALTGPPPVPSSSARSSETTIGGRCAAGEMPLDLVGEVVHVDHRALDAGIGEAVEHIVDQRLAADRHQRFRDRAVVRPHARAETRRQHHGAARCDSAICSDTPIDCPLLRIKATLAPDHGGCTTAPAAVGGPQHTAPAGQKA